MHKFGNPLFKPGRKFKFRDRLVTIVAHFGHDGVKHLYEVEHEDGEKAIAHEGELGCH